ncbi:Pycsar system effector family protein [Streptomyces sp. NPDC001315]|uniref:Pycsar system effector family protein n=1 Tax=Streptomyces sp. NPDC001315 TaxID=3364562 RepID=UPI00369ABF04
MTTLDPAPVPAPAPRPDDADPPADLVPLCERLLTELRGEVARADSKASVLVAALGTTAGVSSGLLAGRDWTPAALSATGTALWWAGSAALGLSLFALLLAVLPRYRAEKWTPGRPLSYFGDIQQAVRLGQLETALGDTRRDPTTGLTTALADLSRIAARKHQWIRTGLIAFCTGTVLLPASLLIG